jgi:thymidylate kinase
MTARPAHPLLRRLFAALVERHLSWVLLRLPADLAAPTGDVDILVAPEQCEALRELARGIGFVALPGWESPPNLILVCYDRPSDRWLVLDVVTTISFRSARWQSQEVARQVLGRRQLRDGIAVPADEDAFWLLLLHCLFDKRAVAPHYRRRLAQLAPGAASSAVARAILPARADSWSSGSFTDAALHEQWAALEQEGQRLGAQLKPRGSSFRSCAARTVASARRPLLLSRRRGLSVALVGPNGVGKSTVAAGLQRAFPFESRIVYMGLWRATGSGFGGTLGAAAMRPLRIWRRYLLARYHQSRGRLVVFDRYVYEAALPPRPPFRALKRPYHWFLRHAVPAAEVVVLLDVPGQVAYGRKQENPPEELEWERGIYRGLASSVPSFELVDASREQDAVRADVMAIVWRRNASRWQGNGHAARVGGPPHALDRRPSGS